MSKEPEIKITGGCAAAFIILAAGLPCLIIWYFGMLSIALSLVGVPLTLLGMFGTFYPDSKVHERVVSIVLLLAGLAAFYWVYTIHYA